MILRQALAARRTGDTLAVVKLDHHSASDDVREQDVPVADPFSAERAHGFHVASVTRGGSTDAS